MSDTKKWKLDDVLEAAKAPGVKRIRMHPKDHQRVLEKAGMQGGIQSGGSPGLENTISGKPVELDEAVQEGTIETIS